VDYRLPTNDRTTLLIVSDEVLVRNWLSGVLWDSGYSVLSAANADEASEIAAAFSQRIGMLLICMPHARGLEVATYLGKNYLGMRALVTSTATYSRLSTSPTSAATADLVRCVAAALSSEAAPRNVIVI
jgi:DNA-binding NtrC family response regulator